MSSELFSPDSDPEQIYPHFSLQWYNGRSLALLTLTSVNQTCIEQFVHYWENLEENWPGPGHIRVMFDFSSPEMSLTPYFRPKLESMIDQFSVRPGQRIFVMSKVIITQSMQMFFVNSFRHKKISDHTDVCFSRQTGFEWFKQDEAR